MASNKTKAAPAKRKTRGTAKSKSKTREPPAKVIIRRNAAPAKKPSATKEPEAETRTSMTERVDGMGASHVAAGVGIGTLGNVAGVIAVGQGWIGPKVTAGILMGTGAAATAAGWYWEWDHVMAAGVGLTAAGAFSISNQLAIDGYEAVEKRSEEKRLKKEEDDKAKRLADARALLEAEKKQQRNARQIVILDEYGDPIEDSHFAAIH